jgi:hypothetical protein
VQKAILNIFSDYFSTVFAQRNSQMVENQVNEIGVPYQLVAVKTVSGL